MWFKNSVARKTSLSDVISNKVGTISQNVKSVRGSIRPAKKNKCIRRVKYCLLLVTMALLTYQLTYLVRQFSEAPIGIKWVKVEAGFRLLPTFLFCPSNWANPKELERLNISISLMNYMLSLLPTADADPSLIPKDISVEDILNLQKELQDKVNVFGNGTLHQLLTAVSYNASEVVQIKYGPFRLSPITVVPTTTGICYKIDLDYTRSQLESDEFTIRHFTREGLWVFLDINRTKGVFHNTTQYETLDLLFSGSYSNFPVPFQPIFLNPNHNYMITSHHSQSDTRNTMKGNCNDGASGLDNFFHSMARCRAEICSSFNQCIEYVPGATDHIPSFHLCSNAYFRMAELPHQCSNTSQFNSAFGGCLYNHQKDIPCTLMEAKLYSSVIGTAKIHTSYSIYLNMETPLTRYKTEEYYIYDFSIMVSNLGGAMGLWRTIWWISSLALTYVASTYSVVKIMNRMKNKKNEKKTDIECGTGSGGSHVAG